ncbi:MAG: 4-hydroxythreonine-4-phosphate dehydrogenase PdxA, partial [bacterium]
MPARKNQALRPVIALTPGDPAGIGPEIVLRAAADPALARLCRLVVVGDRKVMEPAARVLSAPRGRKTKNFLKNLEFLEGGKIRLRDVQWGKTSAAAGRFSYECLESAVRLVLAGKADALVTAPISKKAWELAGLPYPGHTE